MATNQQLESALERIVATVRSELAAAFQRHAAEVAERSAAEREAAVRQAGEAVRKETQDQLEQARRAAQEQIDSARRIVQAEAAARTRAEAQVEDVRRIGRTQVDEVQRMMNERLSAMARELDESRREIATRRNELDSAHGASAAPLTDLARGLHAVDEAESLTAVFERVLDGAKPHSNGAAILLVRDDGFREWATAGLEGRGVGDRGLSVASSAAQERRRVESESAIAFPVSVGGEVVAVLYAEVSDALSPQRRISKDALDALTRHAGRVLESLTVQQAAGLRPVRRESSAANRGGGPMGERLS